MSLPDINYSQLSETEIALSDIFAKANPDGSMSRSSVTKLQTFLNTIGVSGYKGIVTPNVGGIPQVNGADITENGNYIVSADGDYGTITGISITNKFVLLDVKDIETTAVYDKAEIPLNIVFDSIPIFNSESAVWSGGIFNEFQNKSTEIQYTNYDVVGKSFNSSNGSVISNNSVFKGFQMIVNDSDNYEAIATSDYALTGVGCYSGEPSSATYLGLATTTKTDFVTNFTPLANTTIIIFGVNITTLIVDIFKLVNLTKKLTKQSDFETEKINVQNQFNSLYKVDLTIEQKGFNSTTGSLVNNNATFLGAWFDAVIQEYTIEGQFTPYAGVGCYSSTNASSSTYLGQATLTNNKFTPLADSVYCVIPVNGGETYTDLSIYNSEKRVVLTDEMSDRFKEDNKYYRAKLEVVKKSFNTSTGALINNNSTYRGMEAEVVGLTTYVVSSKEPWHIVFGVGCYSGDPSESTYLGVVSLRSVGKEVEFETLANTTNIIIGVLGTYSFGDIYLYNKESYLINVNDDFRSAEFEINSLKTRCTDLGVRNDFSWKTYDKGYVSFVIDDGNNDVGTVADVFISKNVPVCLALPKERIRSEVTTSTAGTDVLSIADSVVTNGGEILAHSYTVITSANSFDFDTMYESFALSKKALEENGFEINGMITAGGANWDTADFEECVRWSRMYYKYSDLSGYNTNVVQYNHPRSSMTGKTLAQLKTEIDNAVSNNEWLVFFTHGSSDNLDLTLLADLLDYANSLVTANTLQTTNYINLYNQFKSSDLEQRILNLENI